MLLKVYVYMDIAGRQIDLWIYTVFLFGDAVLLFQDARGWGGQGPQETADPAGLREGEAPFWFEKLMPRRPVTGQKLHSSHQPCGRHWGWSHASGQQPSCNASREPALSGPTRDQHCHRDVSWLLKGCCVDDKHFFKKHHVSSSSGIIDTLLTIC